MKSHHMGAREDFSAELRAYFMQGIALQRSSNLVCMEKCEPAEDLFEADIDLFDDHSCQETHCVAHCDDADWQVPTTWCLSNTK